MALITDRNCLSVSSIDINTPC